jgi:prephenate dehydrogenase
MKRVSIVGLGLIGGSIAKALRKRLSDVFLLAVDRGDVGLRTDVEAVVSEFVPLDSLSEHRQKVLESDLVILCQPVRVIVDTVGEYLAARTVVTDTGSTKRRVAERAGHGPASAWFVPGHPMAGKAQGGFENADAELFEGRPWILCPEGRDPDAVARVEALIDLVGAKRIVMSPEQHDAAVAITSHLPQLFASFLRRAGSERNALGATGPAFSEMTRTAGGAEAIWRDIFETNADEVGRALREAAFAFAALSDALLGDPPQIEVVLALLRTARASKNR